MNRAIKVAGIGEDVRHSGPERDLLVAILGRAVRDLKETESLETREDAREWLESTDSSPFSFPWICEVLGIEPELFRRETLRESVIERLSNVSRGLYKERINPYSYEKRGPSW